MANSRHYSHIVGIVEHGHEFRVSSLPEKTFGINLSSNAYAIA